MLSIDTLLLWKKHGYFAWSRSDHLNIKCNGDVKKEKGCDVGKR